MIYVIAYLFSNILATLGIERIMGAFLKQEKKSLSFLVFLYAFRFIITSLAYLAVNVPVVTLLINIVTLFFIAYFYESEIIRKCFIVFFVMFIYVTADVLTIFLFNYTFITVLDGIDANVHTLVIGNSIVYMLAALIRRFRNLRTSFRVTPLYWLSFVAIPLSTAFTVILIFATVQLSQIVGLIFILAIIGVNAITLNLYNIIVKAHEDSLKVALESKEKEYYLSQCHVMQESSESLKAFRHDMQLHFAMLHNLASAIEANEIVKYLSSLTEDMERSKIHCDTGNLALDSVINHKLRNIGKTDIQIDMDILMPPTIGIEISDIVTILGNLLDNAIDAVDKLANKWISVTIKLVKGNLYILVKNPYEGEIRFKDGDDSELVSIKHGDEHGYGLKNIRRAVDKYNGELKISTSNNVFAISMLLFLQ